jgi:putative intracellular protease/amidase
MHDVEDIRITLQHLTQLDLIIARRVHTALRAGGWSDARARAALSRGARAAWSHFRNFVEVLAEDAALTSLISEARLSELAQELRRESEAIAAETLERLTNNPVFRNAVRLDVLGDQQILDFDCLFVPGGHGPMVDMANNADVGHVLRLLHSHRKTIACHCHGPAALLSAGETAQGRWWFDGYKLTSFTNEEESQTRLGLKGMPWYLETALKNQGAIFDDSPFAWTSHVVVDRNLITSQNPASSDAAADAVLKQLGLLPASKVSRWQGEAA